jgi:hypothetical protein
VDSRGLARQGAGPGPALIQIGGWAVPEAMTKKQPIQPSIRSLQLTTQTIRPLAPTDLAAAVGGSHSTATMIQKPGH